MEVKDIFELRKQGRIEEAYDLIREKYKTYHGYHTTMCMFWCASDMVQLRIEEGRIEEAELIYKAMQRMMSHMTDTEGTNVRQMIKLERILKDVKSK